VHRSRGHEPGSNGRRNTRDLAEALGLFFEDEPGFEFPEPLTITPVDVRA